MRAMYYRAQDRNGNVFDYETKPITDIDQWIAGFKKGLFQRVFKGEVPNHNWRTACFDLLEGEPVIIDGILCAPGTVKYEPSNICFSSAKIKEHERNKIFGTVNDAIKQYKTNRTPEQFDEHLRETSCTGQDRKHSHYFKDVSNLDVIDVYRIIDLWKIKDPCDQHALKKILCPGERGHKDIIQDTQDVIDTMQRKLEMFSENVK